ncbi:MerR family transcriptional regulator [Liquorilactobacillus oeni]|uniref:HTH merR-type domain-containing protein n=1 Tax=Liquorilactobacillus oeni DSM 19972 TaxID=1423777 RepID=A0A0R1MH93_9LACO|nr:MerR family transcriptional regulator [Liquorilactobacillus oeni]KRL04578.1 hypothetical protein FD46_GL001710 [Liquorilactobacillus oeni DSM 19972]
MIEDQVIQFSDFKEFSHDIIRDDNVYLGISELSLATGVPQNQLRYWNERGYIHSVADMKLKFCFNTILLVRGIKLFQKRGFTLSAAVKKASVYTDMTAKIKKMLSTRITTITNNDDTTEIDLGVFDPQPDKRLVVKIKDDSTLFELK